MALPCFNGGAVGGVVTKSAFKTAWQRLMKKSVNADVEHFTFHDLKAKSISDFEKEGGEQLAGGHKSPAMTAIYDRKRKKIDATD